MADNQDLQGHDAYGSFLTAEEESRMATGASRSVPRALTGDPTYTPTGQSNALPRALQGAGNIILEPYQAFLREWERMSTEQEGTISSRSDPGDALSVALTPIAGAIPAVAAAQAGETTLGVFGGRVGAQRLAEQGMDEPARALRTYESMETSALSNTLADPATAASIARRSANMDMARTSEFGGVHRGTEGRLRFELDDSMADMTPHARTTLGAGGVLLDRQLPTVFDHPTLYQAYPELRDTTVSVRYMENVPGGIRGYFDRSTNHIEITASNAMEARSGILHEIQHNIQYIEGFAPGASSSTQLVSGSVIGDIMNDFKNRELFETGAINQGFQSAILRAAELEVPGFGRYVDDIKKLSGREPTLQDLNNFSQTLPDHLRVGGLQEKLTRSANFQIYRAEAGEVEARLAQSRKDLTAIERRQTPVEQERGYIPREQQIMSRPELIRNEMVSFPEMMDITKKLGIPEDTIRIRSTGRNPVDGEMSHYISFPDKDGKMIKVRVSSHEGHPRKYEIDSSSMTPQELEREIRRRMGSSSPQEAGRSGREVARSLGMFPPTPRPGQLARGGGGGGRQVDLGRFKSLEQVANEAYKVYDRYITQGNVARAGASLYLYDKFYNEGMDAVQFDLELRRLGIDPETDG